MDNSHLPDFEPGSNIEISIPRRAGDKPSPFSITSDAHDPDSYQIIVTDDGKDYDSKNSWLVRYAQLGDRIDISEPRNGISFDEDEVAYFIAGGSGITAFISHFNSVDLNTRQYQLFHIVRSRSSIFSILDNDLMNKIEMMLIVYPEEPSFDVRDILRGKDTGRPVYVAGSNRLIADVYQAALELGWQECSIKWDSYALPGRPDKVG